jgi:hypothetical protein
MNVRFVVFLIIMISFFSGPARSQTTPVCKYGETLVVDKTVFSNFYGAVFDCIYKSNVPTEISLEVYSAKNHADRDAYRTAQFEAYDRTGSRRGRLIYQNRESGTSATVAHDILSGDGRLRFTMSDSNGDARGTGKFKIKITGALPPCP